MTTRTLAALALAAVLCLCTTRGAAADDPKLPDAKAFDKLVIDTLRVVHNKGADLYNDGKDFPGAYRVYQGALVTVRPLLAHRPDAQKIIDAGLDAADKEPDAARKAFLLHEAIEATRKHLKAAVSDKKPDEPKKPDPPVKKPDEPKKPVEPPVKKPDEPKKPDPMPVAPLPKDVKPKDTKPKDPVPAAAATVSGVVTFKGKPLAEGEVTLISLNQAAPKVFTAAVKDGAYKFAEAVPAGKYACAVTGKGVPDKYTLANTSGLTLEFAAGANNTDIELK